MILSLHLERQPGRESFGHQMLNTPWLDCAPATKRNILQPRNVQNNSPKHNLKLSQAEGENADDGGKFEVVKGNACGCIRATCFHSEGNQYEVEHPLDTKLPGSLSNSMRQK